MNEDLNLVIGKSINVKVNILVIQAIILDTLLKVTLADFDADFNLRVSKEVAAQRGYGRKVLDKSCHIAWDHGYGYERIQNCEIHSQVCR